jgi:hypothetical protein
MGEGAAPIRVAGVGYQPNSCGAFNQITDFHL